MFFCKEYVSALRRCSVIAREVLGKCSGSAREVLGKCSGGVLCICFHPRKARQILGLDEEETTDPENLRRQFRKKALRLHPDKIETWRNAAIVEFGLLFEEILTPPNFGGKLNPLLINDIEQHRAHVMESLELENVLSLFQPVYSFLDWARSYLGGDGRGSGQPGFLQFPNGIVEIGRRFKRFLQVMDMEAMALMARRRAPFQQGGPHVDQIILQQRREAAQKVGLCMDRSAFKFEYSGQRVSFSPLSGGGAEGRHVTSYQGDIVTHQGQEDWRFRVVATDNTVEIFVAVLPDLTTAPASASASESDRRRWFRQYTNTELESKYQIPGEQVLVNQRWLEPVLLVDPPAQQHGGHSLLAGCGPAWASLRAAARPVATRALPTRTVSIAVPNGSVYELHFPREDAEALSQDELDTADRLPNEFFVDDRVKIAVVGDSGVGKSWLINSLRGLEDDSAPGWAEVDSDETTSSVTAYDHESERHPIPIRYFDHPGQNTVNIPTASYEAFYGLRHYHAVFLVLTNANLATGLSLYSSLYSKGVPVYVLRNMVDNDVKNALRNKKRPEAETLAKIRENVKNAAPDLRDSNLFLVSASEFDRFDGPRLRVAFVNDLFSDRYGFFVTRRGGSEPGEEAEGPAESVEAEFFEALGTGYGGVDRREQDCWAEA